MCKEVELVEVKEGLNVYVWSVSMVILNGTSIVFKARKIHLFFDTHWPNTEYSTLNIL